MGKYSSKLFFVIGTIIVLVFLFFLFYNPARKIIWNNLSSGPRSIDLVFGSIKDFFSKNSISILILGRPGNLPEQSFLGGTNLADALIVVNFDGSKNRINLISIPRDLWIADEKEQFKINEIIIKNKIGVGMSKIEEMTGLFLDGYAMVDLATVKEAIDDLGGVDVVLSKDAVDWVSGYTLKAGEHHLNGKEAIWLIRNRFDEQGDFFREKNQQQIIENLFHKFKNLSTSEKLKFVNKFASRILLEKNSDIDISKIVSLIMGIDLSKVSFKKIVLDFSVGLFKTESVPLQFVTTTQYISVLIPTQGFENYQDIKKYIQEELSN